MDIAEAVMVSFGQSSTKGQTDKLRIALEPLFKRRPDQVPGNVAPAKGYVEFGTCYRQQRNDKGRMSVSNQKVACILVQSHYLCPSVGPRVTPNDVLFNMLYRFQTRSIIIFRFW
jgi:hypothetical protein